ncbi:aromatic amino acid lyase [Agreia sp. COWG]|uniref:aromatic amino acid lyase n=1 Tax=Agreia sp. COWG TaxID=2773266 RepID=UPI0019252613|nr:aromatic amino acid lyase [Agreia sp. COWG]CAD6002806.1 Histidine ammonia-lyase [Agreia sp. COWG]
MSTVLLDGRRITVGDVVSVAGGATVQLAQPVRDVLADARRVVEATLVAGVSTYGVNTHLGAGRDTAVEPDEISVFQNRIIDNHRGSIGDALSENEVRALVFARIVGFSLGGSGVRPELPDAYARLLDGRPLPEVYGTGSVGASDLALLAELAAHVRETLPFAAGEALAAISANSYSIGVGALALTELHALLDEADLVAALSLEALGAAGGGGSLAPFDPRVHARRASPGQRAVAAAIRSRLEGSFLEDPGRASSVQDALSFRTVPQVHGAVRDAASRAVDVVEDELNAPGDNPLVVLGGPGDRDDSDGVLLSNGNFEPLGLALAFETLRVALAHLAGLSERRIAVLSGLATPLRRAGANAVPGLSWYAASATLAEIRHLANPVSTSGTTLSEVEDHASFAPLALRQLQRQLGLVRDIVAIEALHSAELLRAHGGRPDGDGGSVPVLGRGTRQLAAELAETLEAGRETARTLLGAAVKAVAKCASRDTIDE